MKFNSVNKFLLEKELEKFRIVNYIINDDLSIDINGSVNLSYRALNKIPFNFRKVTGHFDCSYNLLQDLIGSPVEVGGDFTCVANGLKTLKGGPIDVGGIFSCGHNDLTSLQYSPAEIGYLFACTNNKLKSLDMVSNVGGNIICYNNQIDSKNTGFMGWCAGKIKNV